MKTSKIEKDVRFLKFYAVFTTLILAFFLTSSFMKDKENTRFEEIDVERINIIEKDGQLKMVISNQERQHPGIVNGKVIERDHPRPPGIIFFNHFGDEMGGLVYGENGPNGQFGSLTWDKVRGDQTIGFRHIESEDGSYLSGISMWQQPNIPSDEKLAKRAAAMRIEDEVKRKEALQALRDSNLLTTHRLFIGKSRNDAAMLEILDMKGQTRLVVMVDTDGSPKILFMNEQGEITHTLPE